MCFFPGGKPPPTTYVYKRAQPFSKSLEELLNHHHHHHHHHHHFSTFTHLLSMNASFRSGTVQYYTIGHVQYLFYLLRLPAESTRHVEDTQRIKHTTYLPSTSEQIQSQSDLRCACSTGPDRDGAGWALSDTTTYVSHSGRESQPRKTRQRQSVFVCRQNGQDADGDIKSTEWHRRSRTRASPTLTIGHTRAQTFLINDNDTFTLQSHPVRTTRSIFTSMYSTIQAKAPSPSHAWFSLAIERLPRNPTTTYPSGPAGTCDLDILYTSICRTSLQDQLLYVLFDNIARISSRQSILTSISHSYQKRHLN